MYEYMLHVCLVCSIFQISISVLSCQVLLQCFGLFFLYTYTSGCYRPKHAEHCRSHQQTRDCWVLAEPKSQSRTSPAALKSTFCEEKRGSWIWRWAVFAILTGAHILGPQSQQPVLAACFIEIPRNDDLPTPFGPLWPRALNHSEPEVLATAKQTNYNHNNNNNNNNNKKKKKKKSIQKWATKQPTHSNSTKENHGKTALNSNLIGHKATK